MAFVGRIGHVLKHASKPFNLKSSASTLSLNQAIRCMSSSKLFIGGISYGMDDTSLMDSFAQYGEVLDARVVIDRDTNRSRGFGFVSFASSEDAARAINAMDGQDLQGRRVNVAYAADKPSRGGGAYGGNGSYGGGAYGGNGGYGGGAYGGNDSYGGNSNYSNYGGGSNYSGNSAGGGGYGSGNYSSGGGYDGNYGGNSGGYGGGDKSADYGVADSGNNYINGGAPGSGSDHTRA